jgi:hypothetical protein
MILLPVLVLAAFGTAYFILPPYVLPRPQSLRLSGVVAAVTGLCLMIPWPDKPLAGVLHEKGLRDLRSYRWILGDIRADRRKKSFERKAFERFAGEVRFEPDAAQPAGLAGKDWLLGRAAGERAWLDEKNGLVWGPALDVRFPAYSEEHWRRAVAACAKREPAGLWALPAMAEFIKARKNGMLDAIDDIRKAPRWYATAYIPDMGLALTAAFAIAPATNAVGSGTVGVRCVGSTPGVPPEGYLTASNEEVLEALK